MNENSVNLLFEVKTRCVNKCFCFFSRNINELPQHSVSGCWGSLSLFNLQMCNSFRQINWLFTLCNLAREVGNLYLLLCLIAALVML